VLRKKWRHEDAINYRLYHLHFIVNVFFSSDFGAARGAGVPVKKG
jgi:hypothetical protein